ncbi:MAG: heme exporter protein CcmB [Candidatus Pacebacteria bacterium]|nr:heme exporter protein CcmB [Candidatus Paceibacterota bacterium]
MKQARSFFMVMIRREVRLHIGQGQAWLGLAVFFCLASLLFPFGVGPEPQLLTRIASGIIWVMVLLAVSLAWERLFLDDYMDGALDQWLLMPQSLALMVLVKVLAQAMVNLAILLLLVPLVALLLGMPLSVLPLVELTLILAMPSLALFGAMGSALSLGAKNGTGLIALLMIPLVLPVLIFAVGAVEASLTQLPYLPHLYLLAAVMIFALATLPLAIAYILRQAVA